MEQNKFSLKEGIYIIEEMIPNTSFIKWDIYAEDGWCFYDMQAPENYNEEGVYLDEDTRIYRLHTTIPKDEEYVVSNIFPVKRKKRYTIQ